MSRSLNKAITASSAGCHTADLRFLKTPSGCAHDGFKETRKETTDQSSNQDTIASVNKILPLPLPERYSPAVEQWVNQTQKAEAWPHGWQSSTPGVCKNDRTNLPEQRYPPQWHPASRNNSYVNSATAETLSGQVQGSETQWHSFSGEIGIASVGSSYQSQSVRRAHDLLALAIFSQKGVHYDITVEKNGKGRTGFCRMDAGRFVTE